MNEFIEIVRKLIADTLHHINTAKIGIFYSKLCKVSAIILSILRVNLLKGLI